MKLHRGEMILVNLDPTMGREINKTRPAIIVSNDIANRFSPLVTIVPLTSQKLGRVYPFEVLIDYKKMSKAKVDQIRTLDKARIIKKIGKLTEREIHSLNEALKLHLGL